MGMLAQFAPPLSLPGAVYPRWMERLLATTLVFNVVDLMLTLLVVLGGLAVEANPLMAVLISSSPVAFALVKLGVVSFGVWVLWRARTRRLAAVGSVVIFSAYSGVMLYHVLSVKMVVSHASTLFSI